MKNQDINIRDPFVVVVDGKYYMYGTRAENFGQGTGGFDVYVGDDLENWSEPKEVFSSVKYDMNTQVNWAPEVHFYKGSYYMLATFTKPNGLRGRIFLNAIHPMVISFLLRVRQLHLGNGSALTVHCISKTARFIVFSATSIHRFLTVQFAEWS